MKLTTLLEHLKIYKVTDREDHTITSIEMDSRKVEKGSLFVCIKGANVDGHNFAEAAESSGAVAIVSEKDLPHIHVPVVKVSNTTRALAMLSDAFYGSPSQRMRLIGVTGTNGKTTVAHILDHIFNKQGETTGLIGTVHMKIAEEKYEVKNTTPDSLFLQRSFAEMVQKDVTTTTMEVSSHALDMGRTWGCDFDVAVFTNLSQDHLDYHHTMEEYRYAKGLLFSQLGNKYDKKKPKFSVLNNDDPASHYFKKLTAGHVLTYGIDNESDVMAHSIQISNNETTFTLSTPNGTFEVNMQLVGKFSVYNVLSAIATSLVLGIGENEIITAIETVKGVPGRFELVNEGQDFAVIVDYAHTPDSLENVLTTVNEFAKGKVYVIVGCGGDRDRTKRPLMAQAAVQHSDFAIFTSDNPRTEDPVQIIKDMEKGVPEGSYKSIVSREEAINYTVSQAAKDDIIVIAGKGHETYQLIGDQVFDFDDRVIASRAIKENLK